MSQFGTWVPRFWNNVLYLSAGSAKKMEISNKYYYIQSEHNK